MFTIDLDSKSVDSKKTKMSDNNDEDFRGYDNGRYVPHMTEVTPPKMWDPQFNDSPRFGSERIFFIEKAIYEREFDCSSFKPVLSWDEERRGTSHNSRFGFKQYQETKRKNADRNSRSRVEKSIRRKSPKQGPNVSSPGTDFVSDEYTAVYSQMVCSDLRDRASFLLKQAAFCRRVLHAAARAGNVTQVFDTERELVEHQTHLRRIRAHLTSRDRTRRF